MKEVINQSFEGERPLYAQNDIHVKDCTFYEGESPLKESAHLDIENCTFFSRYPIWYSNDVKISNCHFEEPSRAGIWYTSNIEIRNSIFNSPKNLRRCEKVYLQNIEIPNGQETLWACKDCTLEDLKVVGEYFAMNSENLQITNLELNGKYSFDGCKHLTIKSSKLITKDAFWNCEDVTVIDSYISAEYIAWNSKNIKLVNCTIESLQGFCYCENLVLENCKLPNTTLAFEYSTVNATIDGKIESIFNPTAGTIVADEFGEITLDSTYINPKQVIIKKK